MQLKQCCRVTLKKLTLNALTPSSGHLPKGQAAHVLYIPSAPSVFFSEVPPGSECVSDSDMAKQGLPPPPGGIAHGSTAKLMHRWTDTA